MNNKNLFSGQIIYKFNKIYKNFVILDHKGRAFQIMLNSKKDRSKRKPKILKTIKIVINF